MWPLAIFCWTITGPADLDLARERLEFTQQIQRIASGDEAVFVGRVTGVEECEYSVAPVRKVLGEVPSGPVTTTAACGVTASPGEEALVSITPNGEAAMTAASYSLEGQPSSVELERQVRELTRAAKTGRYDALARSPNPRDRIVLVELLRLEALQSRGTRRRAALRQALLVLGNLRSHAETVTEEAHLAALKPLIESSGDAEVQSQFAALWDSREESSSASLAELLPREVPPAATLVDESQRKQKRGRKRARKRRKRSQRSR